MRRARAGRTLWPMTAGRWERLHERCTNRQSGVVGAWQAVEHGIAGSTFATFARAHGWQALHPGIWAAPGSPEDYSRAVYAALVSLRFGAILTGESALWAAGAVREPRRVAVLVRPRRHCSPRTGVVAYRGAWVAGDRVERRRGFRCAPVLRAVTDHARDSGRDAVVKTLVELDRLREASPAAVLGYLERRGRFLGVGTVRYAARRLLDRGLSHSGGEAYARRLLREAGVDVHARPFTVVAGGVIFGEIDLACLAVRYGAEVDGPVHDLPEVAAADKVRDRRLRRIDWTIDRFRDEEVRRDPAGFVRAVRDGRAAAARRGVEAWPG